jgi:hypothetical protein
MKLLLDMNLSPFLCALRLRVHEYEHVYEHGERGIS